MIVLATYGHTNGVRYRISRGVRGVLVRDRERRPVVYLSTEPAAR